MIISNYKDYINSLHIPIELKEKLLKIAIKFKNTGYEKYASNFFLTNPKHLNLLNISGYFYFIYTIYKDRINDNQISTTITESENATFFLEESVKILTLIFNNNTIFWKLRSKRKNEYLKGVLFDNNFNLDISIIDYEAQSDFKSALLLVFSPTTLRMFFNLVLLTIACWSKDQQVRVVGENTNNREENKDKHFLTD